MLIRYLRYLATAQTRYFIHSPFVYTLIKKVLRDHSLPAELKKIEGLRKGLLKDKRAIAPQDLGAGSRKGSKGARSLGEIARSTAVNKKYGRLLYRLSRYFEAKNIIELGTGCGLSALCLAAPMQGGRLISIEGNPMLADAASELVKKAGIEGIDIIHGSFEAQLPAALQRLGKVDIAYIDGDHRRESVLANFEAIAPYLHNDSLVIVDDINWSDDMQQAWQEVCKHPSVTLSISFFRMGLLFSRREMHQQHFELLF